MRSCFRYCGTRCRRMGSSAIETYQCFIRRGKGNGRDSQAIQCCESEQQIRSELTCSASHFYHEPAGQISDDRCASLLPQPFPSLFHSSHFNRLSEKGWFQGIRKYSTRHVGSLDVSHHKWGSPRPDCDIGRADYLFIQGIKRNQLIVRRSFLL